jgi:hypothetical protein
LEARRASAGLDCGEVMNKPRSCGVEGLTIPKPGSGLPDLLRGLIVATKAEISKSIESCLSYLKSVEQEVSDLVRQFEDLGDTMKSAIDSLGNAVSELADAVEAMAEDHSRESRP